MNWLNEYIKLSIELNNEWNDEWKDVVSLGDALLLLVEVSEKSSPCLGTRSP